MATPAQVLANQANAQLSTGPNTAAGLTLGVLTLSSEEQARFCEFEANLRAECKPEGILEREALQQFLDAAARIGKIRAIVAGMIDQYQDDPLLQPETEAKYRQLNRYRAAPKCPLIAL